CHLAFAPEEGVESLVRPGGGAADHVACIVHPDGGAESPPEGAQVLELSPAPEEGVSSLVSGHVGLADDLAPVVDGGCEAPGAPQGAAGGPRAVLSAAGYRGRVSVTRVRRRVAGRAVQTPGRRPAV